MNGQTSVKMSLTYMCPCRRRTGNFQIFQIIFFESLAGAHCCFEHESCELLLPGGYIQMHLASVLMRSGTKSRSRRTRVSASSLECNPTRSVVDSCGARRLAGRCTSGVGSARQFWQTWVHGSGFTIGSTAAAKRQEVPTNDDTSGHGGADVCYFVPEVRLW